MYMYVHILQKARSSLEQCRILTIETIRVYLEKESNLYLLRITHQSVLRYKIHDIAQLEVSGQRATHLLEQINLMNTMETKDMQACNAMHGGRWDTVQEKRSTRVTEDTLYNKNNIIRLIG